MSHVPSPPHTALLVAGDAAARAVVTQALRRLGCDVVEAAEAAAALDALGRRRIDLVILDTGGPGGLPLLEQVRQARPGLPVLALDERSRRQPDSDALRRGAQEVLFKPLQPDEVAAALARLLPAPPPGPAPAGPDAPETVLVLEDHEGVRLLAEAVLRQGGYTVLTAREAAEALGLCRQHAGAIRLLVTDLLLPDMSGRQAAEQARALLPGLPVLYVSGYSVDDGGEGELLPPGADFLQKPFSPEKLLARVRALLGGGGG